MLLLKTVKLPFGFWIPLSKRSGFHFGFHLVESLQKKIKKESSPQTSTTLLFTAENTFQGTCPHLSQLLPTT